MNQEDGTSPETENLDNSAGDETIMGAVDDILESAKEVVSSATDALKSIFSNVPHASPAVLKKMKLSRLKELAYMISKNEGVEYESISDDKASLIDFIEENQGPIELHGGIGIVIGTKEMKEFKKNLTKMYAAAKKTGMAINVFAARLKKQLMEKYGAIKGKALGSIVDSWYDAEIKDLEDLSHLGFSANNETRVLTKGNLTVHRVFSGERLSDIMAEDQDIELTDIEEQTLNNDGDMSSNSFSFSAKHVHSMNDRIFLEVFGLITKDEYYRLIDMAQKADTATDFINGILKNFIGNKSNKQANDKAKGQLQRFYTINQKVNRIQTAHQQRFIVMRQEGQWGIRPRPPKLYGKDDSKIAIASFAEIGLDGTEDKDMTEHLAIVSLTEFFTEMPNGEFDRGGMPGKIDKAWLYNEHLRLGRLGWAIVGVKATTSPSLILAKISDVDRGDAQGFTEFFTREKALGNIDERDLTNYNRTFAQFEAGNIDEIALEQEIAIYKMMQKLRTNNILSGGPSVPNLFKRLALDLSNGAVPVGMGDFTVLVLDLNDMIVKDAAGNVIDHFRADGKSYRFDGQLFTSSKLLNRLGKVFDISKLGEAKGVIRYKDEAGNYITIKSQWMTPPGGYKIYNKSNELVATFEDVDGEMLITDKKGRLIDFVGTNDEVKNLLGNEFLDRKNRNVPLILPEESLRLKSTVKDNKHSAPFPNLWLELLSSEEDSPIRKKLSEYLYTEIVTRFLEGDKGLFAIFGDHKNEKYIKRLVQEIGNRDGGVPTQTEKFFNNLTGGFGHPIFKKGLKSLVKNKILIDKVFGVRLPSTGTLAVFAADVDGSLGKDEFQIGISNKFMRQRVLENYLLKTPEAMEEVAKFQEEFGPVRGTAKWIKSKGGIDGVVDVLNVFLQDNELNYFEFRNPINQKTEARVKRLTKLLPSNRGNVIVNSTEDTFAVHLADHDGDEGMLIDMPAELLEELREHLQWSDENTHRSVDLDVFKATASDSRFSSANDRFAAMAANTSVLGAVGQIVNMKRVRGVLTIKGISDFKLTRKHKGRIVFTKIALRRPEEIVTMWYAPLSDAQEDLVKLDPKVTVIEYEGERYMQTTSDHEMAILVNAATDNPEHGFLGSWGVDSNFLMGRIFKMLDKNGDEELGLTDKSGLVINEIAPAQLGINDIKTLRELVNRYKYGRILQGRATNGAVLDLTQIVNISKSLVLYMNDENGNIEKRLNTSINFRRQQKGNSGMPMIREITVNGKRVLAEELIMSIHKQQTKYQENNPMAKFWGEDFMSDLPFRTQQANSIASNTIGQKNYMNSLIKKYKMTEQDFIDGKNFLEKLLFGDSKFHAISGKYIPVDTKTIIVNGKDQIVAKKPGFYDIFVKLKDDGPKNMTDLIKHMGNLKQTLDGYTYDDGIAELMDNFVDEFFDMTPGAQAATIHSFLVGAKVGKMVSKGKTIPMTPVRPSQITQILPAEFMSVSIDGDENNRDFSIIDDWLNSWQTAITDAQLPVKKVEWTKETYGNLQEIFNC